MHNPGAPRRGALKLCLKTTTLFEIRIGQRMERAVSVRVGAAVAVVIFVRGVRTLS
jgi:hypothetical protein